MQIVFSIDVELEQGEVKSGQTPSLFGLIASMKGLPPRLPQIMTPPKSRIVIDSTASTNLVHVLLFPFLEYYRHSSLIPPHFLVNIISHSGSQPLFTS